MTSVEKKCSVWQRGNKNKKHTLAVVWVIGKHKQEQQQKKGKTITLPTKFNVVAFAMLNSVDWLNENVIGSENSIRLALLTTVSRLITKSYVEQLVAFGSYVKPTRHIICVRL